VRVVGKVLIMLLLASPYFAFSFAALHVAGRGSLSGFRRMAYCGIFTEYSPLLLKIG
jgi:hypothetical protein